jgi:hypothetical protein
MHRARGKTEKYGPFRESTSRMHRARGHGRKKQTAKIRQSACIARACARANAPPLETFTKPDLARISGFLQGNDLHKLPDDFG